MGDTAQSGPARAERRSLNAERKRARGHLMKTGKTELDAIWNEKNEKYENYLRLLSYLKIPSGSVVIGLVTE
jgi:hypothetical protein